MREQCDNNETLGKIFSRINMADLPAMSEHVQELVGLIGSRKASAVTLADVILKDYSLTNKVLQVVNSAYYNRGKQISSISKAVVLLGFQTIRELATALALFEDLLKAGLEKEHISVLLTQSFLSAVQARLLSERRKINVSSEEAFISTMLFNLGKIIILVYLPEYYREIQARTAAGQAEEEAAAAVLDELNFHQVGQEIARFWNFSDSIISCMTTSPKPPRNSFDSEGFLKLLVFFSNRFTNLVCEGQDFSGFLRSYQRIFALSPSEALGLLAESIDYAADTSQIFRYGLSKMKLRSKVFALRQECNPPPLPASGTS